MNEPATVGGIFFAFLLAIVVTGLAKKRGYFQLPPKNGFYPLRFKEVVGAFATYAIVTFIIFPVLILTVSYSTIGVLKGAAANLPKETLLWLQLITFFILFFALLIYLKALRAESRIEILWGGKREKSSKNIAMGLLTLVIAYPTVLFVSTLLNFLTLHFFGKSGIEQAAVRQLKALTHTPALFTMMAIGVVFIIPFVEELLFRGFLQTYLRRYLGRAGAILLSSALFAMAHFAKGQGVGNIELICSLFVLSCYLGFIYERQRSLIAPYALHLFFNGATIMAIAWS